MAKDIREEVRRLRADGVSEEDAIRRAAKSDDDDSDEPDVPAEDDTDDVEPSESSEPSGRQFVIVTKDFSGLGWAKKLQSEGETVCIATDYTVCNVSRDAYSVFRYPGPGLKILQLVGGVETHRVYAFL